MYIAATPAKLTSLRHSMDNIISGTIVTGHGTHTFRSRSHVINAVNRIYRNVAWKASVGETLLIDGDLGQSLILDHLEPQPLTFEEAPANMQEYLERIVAAMGQGPDLASTHRKSRTEDGTVHVRWNRTVKALNAKGIPQDAILHGQVREGQLLLAAALKEGGQHVPLERATRILKAIAPSIGIPEASIGEPAPAPRRKKHRRGFKIPADEPRQEGKRYKHWSPLPYESPRARRNFVLTDDVPF